MPEGHTIHRAARLQSKRFAGHRVRSDSPQGRFRDGAARIDGACLDRITARGKHLFYEFDSGDVVHVHLGLFGKFRVRSLPTPAPSPNCRWLLWTETDELHLAGPTACELISPEAAEQIRDRLGPDPLVRRQPVDPIDRISASLARRSVPIGSAIMDQGVVAGIGNVYRSELLYLIGLDPFTPAREVGPAHLTALWAESVRLLRRGERSGRIVTVDPDLVGRRRPSELRRDERLYCYKRDGRRCRRCGDTIRTAEIAGRSVWWCPTEQQ